MRDPTSAPLRYDNLILSEPTTTSPIQKLKIGSVRYPAEKFCYGKLSYVDLDFVIIGIACDGYWEKSHLEVRHRQSRMKNRPGC
jgi:hypothetical protein